MRRTPGRGRPAGTPERALVVRWQYVVPAAIVVAIIVAAVSIQPGGTHAGEVGVETVEAETATPAIATATPATTPAPASPTAAKTTATPRTTVNETSPGEAIAGAVQTPSPTTHPTPDLTGGMERAQCGAMQESSLPLAVEQNLAGVAVRATNVAVYPVDYLRCILLATGGSQAVTLANAIAEAGRGGATHAALVDLWVANGNRDFAQINLRKAQASAGGETYDALGILNGRGEVVVAGGQSRTVTLVATMTATYGGTTGPITVSFEAPAIGGVSSKGKYQLFLPTP